MITEPVVLLFSNCPLCNRRSSACDWSGFTRGVLCFTLHLPDWLSITTLSSQCNKTNVRTPFNRDKYLLFYRLSSIYVSQSFGIDCVVVKIHQKKHTVHVIVWLLVTVWRGKWFSGKRWMWWINKRGTENSCFLSAWINQAEHFFFPVWQNRCFLCNLTRSAALQLKQIHTALTVLFYWWLIR